jgi:hypothetical protein
MLIALMVLTVFISGCGTTDIVTPEVKLSRNSDLLVFDNWKGILGGRNVTLDAHYYGDAEGKVGLNYRKGQGDNRVNMVASGLKPGVEYELKFLVTDPNSDFIRQHIGYFTADPNGVGNLNVKDFIPDDPNFANADEAFISVYKGAWRVLTTNGDAVGGGGIDLEPVGSNRGE